MKSEIHFSLSQFLHAPSMENIPAINLSFNEHILFLGDSLTRRGTRRDGFIHLFSRAIHEKPDLKSVRITGSGISGNRVPDLLARLKRDVLRKKPTLVIIFIGINDVWHSRFGEGTPEPEFRSGLHSLLHRIQASGVHVLLCTPSVIGEKTDGGNSMDGELDRYSDISRQTAAALSVPLLDLRRLFITYLKHYNTSNQEKGLLTLDGVHLNERGNRFLAECMLKVFFRST